MPNPRRPVPGTTGPGMRDAFHYCLCLLMVEAGRMRLVENGEICVFETAARRKFSVTRPDLSRDQEAALIDVLREILKDEEEL